METLIRRAALDASISKQSLRVLDVILCELDQDGIARVTASEIARRLNVPESTVFRALKALQRGKYLVRESYAPGTSVLRLAGE